MPNLPRQVNVVEVGPRDGLQNEAVAIPTEIKIAFVRALAAAGLHQIEVGSFVHPKLVPQLADTESVLSALVAGSGPIYSALVPNERGLDRALATGVKRIAVFTAASEAFAKKNIGMSIDESLGVFSRVIPRAIEAKISVRAYLSTSFVCPFEGRIDKRRVGELVTKLLVLGADEVAISDTIGAAVPTDVYETVGHVLSLVSGPKIALHFHDTYGTALANVLTGLELGVTTFDSSAGGLGGCPFAPGASGNLATEDLVYMLHGMGIETGVDAGAVIIAADIIGSVLGRPLRSAGWRRAHGAISANCARPS